MPTLLKYQIVSDSYTTYRIDEPGCVELCTLDSWTYVSVPDGVTLPDQPAEIAGTIEAVVLTDGLREQIKAASPHTQLIAQRVIERIRERYGVDDELYFARIMIGAQSGLYELEPGEIEQVTAFKDWAEAARLWGREQRAALGL